MKQIVFFLFLFFSLCLGAQQDSVFSPQPVMFGEGINYNFVMKNETTYTGVVIGEDADFVSVTNKETKDHWDLRKSEILHYSRVSSGRSLEDIELGENTHRRDYMVGTSAFLFTEGEISTNGHWFLIDQIDYAFSENVAMSVHTLAFYPMALGLKTAFKVGEMDYIGASISGMVNLSLFSNAGPMLMGYLGSARYTHGSDNRNITVSAGLLGLNSTLLYEFPTEPYVNTPFTSIAFCNRFAKRTAVNIEGWYLPNEDIVLAGLGIKFLESDTNCWTFGCYTLMQRVNNNLHLNLKALPIPYIGLSRKFN